MDYVLISVCFTDYMLGCIDGCIGCSAYPCSNSFKDDQPGGVLATPLPKHSPRGFRATAEGSTRNFEYLGVALL